jgi:hypothetical protein
MNELNEIGYLCEIDRFLFTEEKESVLLFVKGCEYLAKIFRIINISTS